MAAELQLGLHGPLIVVCMSSWVPTPVQQIATEICRIQLTGRDGEYEGILLHLSIAGLAQPGRMSHHIRAISRKRSMAIRAAASGHAQCLLATQGPRSVQVSKKQHCTHQQRSVSTPVYAMIIHSS